MADQAANPQQVRASLRRVVWILLGVAVLVTIARWVYIEYGVVRIPVSWTDFSERGFRVAVEKRRPVLLMFYQDSDSRSEKLANVLADPQVRRAVFQSGALTMRMVCRDELTQVRDLRQRFQVDELPCLVVVRGPDQDWRRFDLQQLTSESLQSYLLEPR